MATSNHEQILIISSDTQINYLTERTLRAAGYVTTAVSSQDSAIKYLEKTTAALVILHEKLDGRSSIDLARQLNECFPVLPVVLLVDKESHELLRQALRVGVSDYLSMPLRSDALLRAVEENLSKAQKRKEWVILESRRATATLQQQVDELETLSRLGRSITRSLDLDAVLSTVVTAAVDLTGAEEGSLLLVDDASGELYMRAARNFHEEFVRTFRLPVTDSLAGSVIKTGLPLLVDDSSPQKIKTSYLVQALIYVPLRYQERTFGVLGVDNRQNRTPFTAHHARVLAAIADYAVIAIENARLFSETTSERTKLETILTNVQDGAIVLDSDGRILLINQTAHAAFCSDENPITKPAVDVLAHPDLLALVSDSQKAAANRVEVALEDGRVFSAQRTRIQDVGLVVTLHDITYLKKLDRIKSDFVGTVSHDLRSPLTAILGYVELLDRVGPVNDIQRDFIRRIQTSVHNITSLIDDLLNLGKIEAGFDTRKELLLLNQVIGLTVDGLKSRIEKKQIVLTLSLPEPCPNVLGNPIQLRQMTDNLIENAVKYTPPGGSVTVTTRLEGSQIIMQVTDTGVGIPAIDLPYIFDKFYRASNVSTEIAGTGLGLAIVKSIVESHQGRIWVESTPEKGTTLTVVLPVAP